MRIPTLKASKNNWDKNRYKPGDKIAYSPSGNFTKDTLEGKFYQNVPSLLRWYTADQQDKAGIKYKQPQYGFRLGGYGHVWKETAVNYIQIIRCPEQKLI